MSRSLFGSLALAGLLAIGAIGGAAAQTINPTPLPNIGPADLIPEVSAGGPSALQQFVTPTQIAGAPGYTKAVPVTGFAYTFAKAQAYMLLSPAATLANGNAVTEANPSDGQRECIRSTQAVTAFTYTANPLAATAQTINGAPTTLTAGTVLCFTYSKTNATWDPS